jgi:hypothetical protein
VAVELECPVTPDAELLEPPEALADPVVEAEADWLPLFLPVLAGALVWVADVDAADVDALFETDCDEDEDPNRPSVSVILPAIDRVQRTTTLAILPPQDQGIYILHRPAPWPSCRQSRG